MHMRGLTKKVLPVILLLVSMMGTKLVSAQSDKIEGLWFNDIKDAKIQIYKARDGKFYGKIIWLKEPTKEGKPKLNYTNTGAAKKELSDYAVVSGGYDRIYYKYFMQFKPLTISDNRSELSTNN